MKPPPPKTPHPRFGASVQEVATWLYDRVDQLTEFIDAIPEPEPTPRDVMLLRRPTDAPE